MARNSEPMDLDDDDRPRRKAKPSSGGFPIWGWVLLGGSGLVIVMCMAICGGVYWFGNKVQKDRENADPDVTMTAQVLMDETNGNRAAATKYQGKMVRLTGKLEYVGSNNQNKCFLSFIGKGDSPRCFFDSASAVANIKKGDTITVQGRLYADGGRVDLSNCRLVSP
jgi:hypothetical protein